MHLPRRYPSITLILFCLAFLHGLLYATLTPPWGLIDEAQHFHYIKFIAENRSLPIEGETLLSADIVESLFATRHWQTFHWQTPAGHSIEQLGAVGYSYEAYQPPLFYLLLAPLFSILPADVLTQLFLLRGVMVILSLTTLYFLWRTVNLIFPHDKTWTVLVLLLLVALPERTFAVSRLNNDVLLEVFGSAIVWLCTCTLVYGLTVRRAIQLSLLLAIGLWVKLSLFVMIAPVLLLFWRSRYAEKWKQSLLISSTIVGFSFFLLVARNSWLYGDWSGISAFHRIMPIHPPDWTLGNFLSTIYRMFAHVWVIWWKGAESGSNLVIVGFYILFAIVLLISLFAIRRQLSQTFCPDTKTKREIVIVYLFMIVAYAGATIVSYFQGMIPVVQGRFLLPVMIPIVVVWSWGVRTLHYGKWIMLSLIGVLFLLDFLSLWGNLLPFYYYWSAFPANDYINESGSASILYSIKKFVSQLAADKPIWVGLLLPWIVSAYSLVLAWTIKKMSKCILST